MQNIYSIFKEVYRFIKHIIESKNLLYTLAMNDFKEQFLGSYLGIFWAILRPALFMLVVWFVFSIGFKGGKAQSDVPFVLYLMSGYIPWFFFSEAVIGGMNSVVNNRFLVKKVAFRVSILPIVKILSALFLHLIFIGILIVVFFLYGYTPSIYWLQLPYYIFCMVMLLLGMSWLLAALRVFMKDIGQIIGVLMQLGFWVSPIFWSIKMVPAKYVDLIHLNPMVYILEGYRNSFIDHIWFWEQKYALYYFAFSIFFLVFGVLVFKRLRPHFGDVL